jgi:hypothetical protein
VGVCSPYMHCHQVWTGSARRTAVEAGPTLLTGHPDSLAEPPAFPERAVDFNGGAGRLVACLHLSRWLH